jgi:glucose/arabinose dehydrogenase
MRVVIAFVAVVTATSPVAADLVDPSFRQNDHVILDANPQVTSMAWAPDGSSRLFVTGKEGHIWIVKNGAVLPTPAYRFVPRTQNGELVVTSDSGLLGIAFDPAFADNHYVYVFATVHRPPTSNLIEQQIIRFTMQGDTATERTTLIAGLPSRGGIHGGGALAFGPDGLVYWGVGDDGEGNGVGEDLASAGSKISRASTTPGAPPPPGPFVDGDGPNYDYTFARGARNPFKMAFHPVTGTPWVNVVGAGWEQIFAANAGDHFGYPVENVEPGTDGVTRAPIVAYRTAQTLQITATSAVRANGTVTITTSEPHRLRKGARVTLAGIDDTSFDGAFTIASVPTLSTFTYAHAAPDAASGDGTARADDYGNVITGGAFYNATLFPPEFRQNYFFGDHGARQLVRVEATDDTVSRVSLFGTAIGDHVDAATGPDGGLYLAAFDGTIRRVTYAATAQNIVVSPQNLRVTETSRGFVGVRLAMAPPSDVTVSFARTSGSSFVRVPVTTLVFTPANWEQPQYVEVTSVIDGDMLDDIATIDATAAEIPAETITVRVTDTREADPSAIDTAAPDGPSTGTGGCCDTGTSSRSSIVLVLLVGLVARRRFVRQPH